jgi:hypothetical protein
MKGYRTGVYHVGNLATIRTVDCWTIPQLVVRGEDHVIKSLVC